MPERPPIQVKKNDKYVIEGYDKKMNVKSRAIIRMGGVNPAPACRGGTACIFCLMQKMGLFEPEMAEMSHHLSN